MFTCSDEADQLQVFPLRLFTNEDKETNFISPICELQIPSAHTNQDTTRTFPYKIPLPISLPHCFSP